MDDLDITELVRQQLDEDDAFDPDAVEIDASAVQVTVAGRVGTEAERQHVGQVRAALGATEVRNHVGVDEAARAVRDEAADEGREQH